MRCAPSRFTIRDRWRDDRGETDRMCGNMHGKGLAVRLLMANYSTQERTVRYGVKVRTGYNEFL